MKLVYEKDSREVHVGDSVETFRGEKCVVRSIEKPHHGGSTGRVYVNIETDEGRRGFFPSVIGAKWIEREDQK